MNEWQRKIQEEVDRMREAGVTGKLMVAPAVNKKCMISCGAGRCNCRSTVGDGYCLVSEERYPSAMREADVGINYIQHEVDMYESINDTKKFEKVVDKGKSTL